MKSIRLKALASNQGQKASSYRWQHALIIGGTGMLAVVTQAIIDQSHRVSLISREPGRFVNSLRKNTSRVWPFALDYHNIDAFAEAFASIVRDQDVDLAVLWIHSSGQIARAHALATLPSKTLIIDIRGSSQATAQLLENDQPISRPESLCRVVLGFHQDADTRRWLTNREISNGVLAAIDDPRPIHIVGSLDP